MENVSMYFVLSLLTILFVIYKFRKTRRIPLPGPKGYPLVGNLPDVDINSLHLKLNEWTKQYGDVFEFDLLGTKMVSLNSSKVIRELFTKEPTSTITAARPPSFVGKWFSEYSDVFTPSYGEKANRRRKYLHQVMHTYGDGLKYIASEITYVLSDLKNDIEEVNSQVCNPLHIIERFIMGTMQILMIGKIPRQRREEFERYLKDIDNCLNVLLNPGVNALFSVFPVLRFSSLKGGKSSRLFKKRRDEFLDFLESLTDIPTEVLAISKRYITSIEGDILDLSREGDEDSNGMYQQMMKAVQSGQHSVWLSKRVVLEFFTVNIIGATYLTTRNTLAAMTRILLSLPDVQKRLQKEVDTIIGQDRNPAVNDRYNMPFAESVILETLRFISHLPLSGLHAASDDMYVRGHLIPKGTTIIPNLWTAHHSSKEWKEPFKFNPDRFFDEDGNLVPADHPLRKQVLAFGIGKRSCIGEVFAKTRIFLFMTTMMQKYSIVPIDGVVPPMMSVYDLTPGIVLEVPDFDCKFERRF